MGDLQFANRWKCMSDFEKVCWTWRAINQELVASSERDPQTRLYRFEDLFLADDRMKCITDMLCFITRFENRSYSWRLLPNLFDQRINQADRSRFSDWHEWSPEYARQLQQICGPLMERFGYGVESEWRAKVD